MISFLSLFAKWQARPATAPPLPRSEAFEFLVDAVARFPHLEGDAGYWPCDRAAGAAGVADGFLEVSERMAGMHAAAAARVGLSPVRKNPRRSQLV